MKIKNLIRKRTITNCFLFDKKAFLILPLYSMYRFIFQHFDLKCLSEWWKTIALFGRIRIFLAVYSFIFFAKFYPGN